MTSEPTLNKIFESLGRIETLFQDIRNSLQVLIEQPTGEEEDAGTGTD